MLRIATLAMLTFLLAPATTQAECLIQTAKTVLASPSIELVFSGQVVEITPVGEPGYRATFEVSRVWKGSVPRRFDLYVWPLSPEVPDFKKGRRYVALAETLTNPRARQGLGLMAAEIRVFTPTQCSDSLSPTFERDLGVGYGPKGR